MLFIPTRLIKLDATAYFKCTKENVKVLSNTLEPDILQKIFVSTQEIRRECKVCGLRYRPVGTMSFMQEYNLLFPIRKKNVIFYIHHLLFQNQYFFLVNCSNLMDTIKTIIILI